MVLVRANRMPDRPWLRRVGVCAVSLIVATLVPLGCNGAAGPEMLETVTGAFADARSLEERPGLGEGSAAIRIWEIAGTSSRLGYLAEKQCQAKSGTFTLWVVLDNNLVVQSATVREYTAQRGIEITSPAFGRQFVGKTASSPIRVGEDIDAITGATVSSRSMANGVREILVALRSATTRQ